VLVGVLAGVLVDVLVLDFDDELPHAASVAVSATVRTLPSALLT
jgi:hypothetical protein